MTDAQQLLSALTPSLKANALTTLGKVAQQDEKNTTLSDDDLANLSALFAMLARTTAGYACRRQRTSPS